MKQRLGLIVALIIGLGVACGLLAGSISAAYADQPGFLVSPSRAQQGTEITLCGNVLNGTAPYDASCHTAASTPGTTTTSTSPATTTTSTSATTSTSKATTTATSGGGTTSGSATPTLPCTNVLFQSPAFEGVGATGTSQTVLTNVNSDGSFRQSLTLTTTVATGSYVITASCGSTTIGTQALNIVPLLPLSDSSYVGEQVAAVITLVIIVALVLLVRKRQPTVRRTRLTKRMDKATDTAERDRLEAARDAVPTATPNPLVGQDNRVSTSKCIALLWTGVVMYGVLTLGYISLDRFGLFTPLLGSFPGVYLVLLGGPFAAAVGAKAIVSNSTIDTGKPARQQKASAGASTLFDIVSDDNSNLDLVDTQYTLLNLVAVIVVLAQFIHHPGFGAPNIPSFLAALTGTSAATYLANKALTTNQANLTRIAPTTARIGQQVAAYGANLVAAGDNAAANTKVTVGGFAAGQPVTAAADQIVFQVPHPPAGQSYQNPAEVVIVTNGGSTVTSQSLPGLTVVPDGVATLDHLSTATAKAGDRITAYGSFFFQGTELDYNNAPIAGVTGPDATLTDPGTGSVKTLAYDATANNTDSSLVYKIPADTVPATYDVTIAGVASNASLTIA